MKQLTRDQAIDAIRSELLKLVDDEHSMCEVATRKGIFCRGFSQWTTGELRKRLDWIVQGRPAARRDELEDLANRWQLARQYVLGTRLACDTQARPEEPHHTCRAWDGFTDEQLARFHEELLGEKIAITSVSPETPGSRPPERP